MSKLASSVLVSLVLAPIAWAASPVEVRANYWRQRLTRELPTGSPRSAILEWVSKNHLTASEQRDAHEFVVGLEYVPEPKSHFSASPTVCNGWGISANIEIDVAGNLTSTKVRTLGNCL
jgi:hypothetical protein